MSETAFFRFQPDAMKREKLEKIFIGKQRKILLNRLAKEITRAVESGKQKHYMIIGPRGVGKTHFIALLYYRLKDKAIGASLVKLSEEEFSVYRVSDLLQRIVETVRKKKAGTPDFENMSNESVITAALEELKSSGESIVLFIENFNQIVGEQMSGKEVKRLRSILQQESQFITVASAPLVFNQISKHDEPFFNFFEIVYLVELSRNELIELLRRIAEVEGNQQFANRLSKNKHKIDAISTLTGGNPRIAILLYDLTSRERILDVESAFFKILDDNTPYYQDIFRMMSGEQRRIFDILIAMRRPATPSEVAKKTRLKQNIVNSQIRRLEKDGYLVSRKFGRATKYEVREKLFRLWRELRKEPFGRKRLRILLEFLELWYSAQERETFLLKCFDHVAKPGDKEVITEASYWFSSLSDKRKEELLPIIIEKSYKLGEMPLFESLMLDERMKRRAIIAQMRLLVKSKKYEELLEVIDKADIESDQVQSFLKVKAATLLKLDRYEEALQAIKKVIELDQKDSTSLELQGTALSNLGRYEEAFKAFTKAVELNPQHEYSWIRKAAILVVLGKNENALEAIIKALELDPKRAISWEIKGGVLGDLGRRGEAVEAITKAIELEPEKASLWTMRGDNLGGLGRYEEALEAATKAIELDSQKAMAWSVKGQALWFLNRFEEALEATTKATELSPESDNPWRLKGQTLEALGRYEEALEAFSKAIELNPQSADLWEKKVEMLENMNRDQEAMQYLSQGIKIHPKNSTLWLKKAEILTKLEKSDAEDAYRKAISLAENELVLNPNDVNALMNKANALMDVESFEDASNILLKIAELLPHPEAKKICKNSAALLSTKAYFDKALKEFAKKNFGNAEIDLKEVVQSLGNIDEKDVKAFAKEDVARFLIKIVELKSTEILRIALAILSQAKGFEEFLNTFKLSLDIVKTKDVAKFYDVQVEKREIIADIVERLSGSKDLLPPEYKKIRKDS